MRRDCTFRPSDVARRLWLAGAGTLAAIAGPAARGVAAPDRLPGLAAVDARVPVDTRAAPWSVLLRLSVPGGPRCSAVLIAPRLAATAAHCVWNPRTGAYAPPGSIHLLAGYRGGDHLAHAAAEAVQVAPGYDPMRPQAARGADLALLHLAAPLPGGPLGLLDGKAGSEAALGGFSQDRAQAALADPGCRVTATAADPAGHPLLLHSCAATRGASGGPLLGRAPDGTWRLLGIAVAASDHGAGGVAVPSASVRRLLESR